MRRFPGAVAITAILLAGCGSSGSDNDGSAASGANAGAAAPASAQQSDPCSLVTADEVSDIIGDQVEAARPADGSCVYETADAQASSVTIELDQSDAAGQMDIARRTAVALKDMGQEAATQGGAAGQDVNAMLSDSGGAPKIGDEAFFGANQQLSVRKGSSYIAISPPMMRSRMSSGNPILSSDEKKRMALAIAEKAVARLP